MDHCTLQQLKQKRQTERKKRKKVERKGTANSGGRGKSDFQSYIIIVNAIVFNKKVIRLTKKQENMAHSEKKNKFTKIIPEEV